MSSPTWRILTGDCRERLLELEDESVHCVVTSPPYFGLRDYGTATWEDGDPACDHAFRKAGGTSSSGLAGGTNTLTQAQIAQKVAVRQQQCRDVCRKCGARRVDSQIGLEPSVDEFVDALVEVFREVRRVLRADGVVWLNLGDSYAGGGGYAGPNAPANARRQEALVNGNDRDGAFVVRAGHNYEARAKARPGLVPDGVKPKDLLMIPAQVALALRADGWYLRSEVIWAKPNPMPESITDRPTRAHEQVYLLSRSPRYFYDADAIREDGSENTHGGNVNGSRSEAHVIPDRRFSARSTLDSKDHGAGRNKRSVWTVATQPYAGAHFATFPAKLIEPCILAGAPERACGECGAPWVRLAESKRVLDGEKPVKGAWNPPTDARGSVRSEGATGVGHWRVTTERRTLGFRPSCGHYDELYRSDYPQARRPRKRAQRAATGDHWRRVRRRSGLPAWPAVPGVVLDPFVGAGTTVVEALRRGRSAVGLELNPTYAEMARQRVRDDAPLLNTFAEIAS
jgi:DNA modification methylase